MNRRQLTSAAVTAVVLALTLAFIRVNPGTQAATYMSVVAVVVVLLGAWDVWRRRTNDSVDIRVRPEDLDVLRYKDIAYRNGGRGAAVRAIRQDYPGISHARATELWQGIIDGERRAP